MSKVQQKQDQIQRAEMDQIDLQAAQTLKEQKLQVRGVR